MSGLTFLSWVRMGPQLDASAPDPLTGPLPAHGALNIGIQLNQRSEVPLPARLYGPGDVTGLDPRQVIRTDPAPDANAVEPSFFPLVEFDAPHLPWLLTPAQARDGERLRPWLVLVVADVRTAKVGAEAGALLPVLRCPRSELPDLDESWAWAHVQVATDKDLRDVTLKDLLRGPPERSLSRLLCPRRLDADTRYVACVVPAFEAGCKRGRGIPLEPADEANLVPAWKAGSNGEIALPVYYHWTFTTGQQGDFESLVQRLRVIEAPDNLGVRPLDVSHPAPGFPMAIDPANPAAVLGLEGALGATERSPWDPDAAATFTAALSPLLSRRPGRIGPPLYGGSHVGVDDVSSAPLWLRELNLDPRHRAAAAFGAEVVRRNQEALMASAWAQAAAVARANDALRQGQLARTAAESAYQRRLLGGAAMKNQGLQARRLLGSAALDSERLLQISAPAHRSLRTETELLEGNQEVQAAISPAFRRLTRPGGPFSRRLADGATLSPPIKALGTRDLTVNPPLQPAPGMVALERLTTNGRDSVGQIDGSRLKKFWWEDADGRSNQQPTPSSLRIQYVGAAMPNRLFMVAEDGRVLSRVDAPVAWHDHGFPPGGVADTQPVAIHDLHAFVRTADGRLCSLGWDGDRWAWQDHGRPDGHAITGRPLALAWNFRLLPDGLVQTGRDYQSVFVCATDGQLWELFKADDNWRWFSRGAPLDSGVIGAPGATGPYELFVHGINGHTYRYKYDGNVWAWSDRGQAFGWADHTIPPLCLGGHLYLRLVNGQLGILSTNFKGLISPPAPASCILRDGDNLWITSEPTSWEPTGRVLRWRNWWEIYGEHDLEWDSYTATEKLRSWVVFRYGEPWAVMDGKLAVLRVASGTVRWDDYGYPTAGGIGEDNALPPQRLRWRGTLGFMSNFLVAHVDNPGGANTAYLRIGRDLGFDGEVRGGWELKQPGVAGMGEETQGSGLAMWDLDGTGRQDVILFWVESLAQGNFGSWRIGQNIGPEGVVSWADQVRRMPTPMSTLTGSSGALTAAYPVQGADVALGDLDGDDRPEMIVAYVSGIPDRQRVFYRIGWRMDSAGEVTGGWTESIEVPWPDRGGTGARPVRGVGVAVADIDLDLCPELVVVLLERDASGIHASYMIGRQINARGRVIGGWTGPFKVSEAPLGQDAHGAAIALADFSGSQLPDLVVFHIENHPTANRAWYRVGFDLEILRGARHWSEPREVHAGAWWGWENQGAGIAIGDLDNALLAGKHQFAENFRTAATLHQELIKQGQQLARDDDQAKLEVSYIADGVRAALEPDRTVTQRVIDRIQGVAFEQLPDGIDRLNPLVVAPTFTQPMSQPLAELSQELLLPGIEHVPPDTITVVKANSTFIEAYMVGLNHELARELLWREFPGDRRATFFRQFWDARAGDPDIGTLTDVPPIHTWVSDQKLGDNATAVGNANMVVLLLRGELLRRYPNASVFARRAAWEGGRRVLGAETLLPQFQHQLPPDLVLFGIPLTATKARGGGDDAGWFFVLAEHPTAPRFGIDDPPANPTYGIAPATWEELHWAAFAQDAAGLEVLRHAPAVATLFGGVELPVRGGSEEPKLKWARNSAHLAHITFQRSVQIAIHATDMLPADGA